MGLFKRFANVIRSNINELIEDAEDPAKLAKLNLTDAKEQYVKLKGDSTKVIANANLAEKKFNEANTEVAKWHNVAVAALKAGNEEDTKAALAKENKAKELANSLKANMDAAKSDADKVQHALQNLKNRIDEMESKVDSIEAKAATASIKKATASFDFDSVGGTLDAIDRMEEKADAALAEAEAMEQMNAYETAEEDAEVDLLSKYSSGDAATDASLEALKAELGL